MFFLIACCGVWLVVVMVGCDLAVVGCDCGAVVVWFLSYSSQACAYRVHMQLNSIYT